MKIARVVLSPISIPTEFGTFSKYEADDDSDYMREFDASDGQLEFYRRRKIEPNQGHDR
jgi:hypothetical protein